MHLAEERWAPAGSELGVVRTLPNAVVDAVIHEFGHLDAALKGCK